MSNSPNDIQQNKESPRDTEADRQQGRLLKVKQKDRDQQCSHFPLLTLIVTWKAIKVFQQHPSCCFTELLSVFVSTTVILFPLYNTIMSITSTTTCSVNWKLSKNTEQCILRILYLLLPLQRLQVTDTGAMCRRKNKHQGQEKWDFLKSKQCDHNTKHYRFVSLEQDNSFYFPPILFVEWQKKPTALLLDTTGQKRCFSSQAAEKT